MAKAKKAGSFLSSFMPGLLGILLITAGTLAAVYYYCMVHIGAQAQKDVAQAHANLYVRQISMAAQQWHDIVVFVANDNNTLRAFSRADGDAELQDTAAQLRKQLPNATHVAFYRNREATKNPNSMPPISFAQLDLIKRAEGGRKPAPEIHIHDGKPYLALSAAAVKGNRVLGTVFVTLDFNGTAKNIQQLNPKLGQVALVQQFNEGTPLTFFKSGSAEKPNVEAIVVNGPFDHWRADFFPAVQSEASSDMHKRFFMIAGAGLLASLLIGLLTWFLLKKKLWHNASIFSRSFAGITQRGKPDAQPYSLDVFESLWKTSERLYRDKTANSTAPFQNQVASTTSANSDDDILDIDIEHEADLLAGHAGASLTTADAPVGNGPPLPEVSDDSLSADNNLMEFTTADNASAAQAGVDLPRELFRAYDIRGIVGQDLDNDAAFMIGQAVASEALSQGQSSIFVAHDGRLSSPDLNGSLVAGMTSTGIMVLDLGMVPTAVLYYATKTQNTQSGVMITGSHNPPDYNGFKVVIAGQTLANDQIMALHERIATNNLMEGKGQHTQLDITEEYIERITNDVVLAKPMNVVVDSGNGVAGPLSTNVLQKLGCNIIPLNEDINGRFPNHHPDPSKPENLQSLIDAVQSNGAELGIAYDGDGDRIAVVTASGAIIWPDRLLMLFARDLLSRNPGSDVIYDVKCSRDVAELVSNMGGRAIMCATGHSLMKAKMQETGAVVGGELSGHIYFNDRWYGFDDGIYSAARLLEILSMEPIDPEDVFAEFPERCSTPEISIPVEEAKKFALMEQLSAQANFGDGNIVNLDGIRVDFVDGWGLIRASNTTPNLVARFEANDEAALARIQDVFRQQLQQIDATLPINF